MREKLLCPSMMCADFSNLKEEVRLLDEAGADILHIDVMDGAFVPNIGMGMQDIGVITKNFSRMVDVHLMIRDPIDHIGLFASQGVDLIYIHPEADTHPARTLQKIMDCRIAPGIAMNPGTAFETVEPLLYLVEYVLVMTVNPGFAGQEYLSFVEPKLERIVSQKERYGYKVILDGACSPGRISRLGKAGADGFVLGTSALFGQPETYARIMGRLREL